LFRHLHGRINKQDFAAKDGGELSVYTNGSGMWVDHMPTSWATEEEVGSPDWSVGPITLDEAIAVLLKNSSDSHDTVVQGTTRSHQLWQERDQAA
jgi:hypothetical protein